MNKETFYKTLEIISAHHSSEIVINQPVNNFVGDLGQFHLKTDSKNE